MLLLRALVARFWREPYRGAPGPVGNGAARPVAAAALRRGRHPRRGAPTSTRAGYPFVAGMVRSVRRVPLSALRHGQLRRHHDRAAAGDRAVARAGRGDQRQRDGALRRLVGRAPAGEGDRHDRRAARGHVQRPGAAAHADRRSGRVRGRRSLPRVEPAVGVAPDDRRAGAADVRSRRHLGESRARRLHVPRRASGRAQLRHVPRQRERGRSAPLRALLVAGPHAGTDARSSGAAESGDADDAGPALDRPTDGDPHAVRAESDRLHPPRQHPLGAVSMGVRAPAWRNVHPAHRRHRHRAQHAAGHAGDHRCDGLARPRLRRGAVFPDAAHGPLSRGHRRHARARPRLPRLHAARRARRAARGAACARREAALRRSLAPRARAGQGAATRRCAGRPVPQPGRRERGVE